MYLLNIVCQIYLYLFFRRKCFRTITSFGDSKGMCGTGAPAKRYIPGWPDIPLPTQHFLFSMDITETLMIYMRMKRKGVDNKTNIRVCIETPLIFVQKKNGWFNFKNTSFEMLFSGFIRGYLCVLNYFNNHSIFEEKILPIMVSDATAPLIIYFNVPLYRDIEIK